jgi:hypothetical protein
MLRTLWNAESNALCIAAKLIDQWQLRVISVDVGWSARCPLFARLRPKLQQHRWRTGPVEIEASYPRIIVD